MYPAFSIASTITFKASSLEERLGAKPPSSPTEVTIPLALRTDLRLWNTSAPILIASAKEEAPTGVIMNSWKSTLLSA